MRNIKMNLKKISCVLLFLSISVNASPTQRQRIANKLKSLEQVNKVRIGVSAWNMKDHKKINYRAHERFPMDSTSKLMTVSAILHKAQQCPGVFKQKNCYTTPGCSAFWPCTDYPSIYWQKYECCRPLSRGD